MNTNQNPAWCKSKCAHGSKCDGGSYGTYSKRVYALAVAVALNGSPVCGVCGIAPVSLTDGEVDRTVEGCYAPGFIVMTCHRCNNERTHVVDFDTEAYALAVLEASQGIEITGPAEAKRMWQAARPTVGETVTKSRFMR